MQIENHREEVPFAHYAQRFCDLDPGEAAKRTGAKWDGNEFYVNLLGREYAIAHPACILRATDGGPLPPLSTQTFLLRWLLEGRELPFLGTWKTFREMPWGEMYFGPYSGRILRRAAFTFGTRLEDFRAAGEKMGAEPVNHADAGWCFSFLGGYRVQILIWEGDEEFPPSAQILYSDNFAQGFTAEDRVVAGDILIQTVKSFM